MFAYVLRRDPGTEFTKPAQLKQVVPVHQELLIVLFEDYLCAATCLTDQLPLCYIQHATPHLLPPVRLMECLTCNPSWECQRLTSCLLVLFLGGVVEPVVSQETGSEVAKVDEPAEIPKTEETPGERSL